GRRDDDDARGLERNFMPRHARRVARARNGSFSSCAARRGARACLLVQRLETERVNAERVNEALERSSGAPAPLHRPRSRASSPLALRALLPLVPLVLGVACESVRAARRAQDPANAVPGERTPSAAELGLATNGVLRLDDALRAAHRAHPSVLRAQHDVEAARARVGEIEGALLPQLSVNASKTYSDAEGSRGGSPHFESLGSQLSWLLFDFDRPPSQARQAAANWLAAQADARSAEIDVDFGVRSAYYQLQKQLHLRDVARDAVTQFQAHLDQVQE